VPARRMSNAPLRIHRDNGADASPREREVSKDTPPADGEGLHGPRDLVRMPIRFLAVTAYPDSRE